MHGSKILFTMVACNCSSTWLKVFRIIPQKVSLKILNQADSYGFFDFVSVYLKTIDLLFKLEIVDIYRHTASLKIGFQKFRIWEILNFHS